MNMIQLQQMQHQRQQSTYATTDSVYDEISVYDELIDVEKDMDVSDDVAGHAEPNSYQLLDAATKQPASPVYLTLIDDDTTETCGV